MTCIGWHLTSQHITMNYSLELSTEELLQTSINSIKNFKIIYFDLKYDRRILALQNKLNGLKQVKCHS